MRLAHKRCWRCPRDWCLRHGVSRLALGWMCVPQACFSSSVQTRAPRKLDLGIWSNALSNFWACEIESWIKSCSLYGLILPISSILGKIWLIWPNSVTNATFLNLTEPLSCIKATCEASRSFWVSVVGLLHRAGYLSRLNSPFGKRVRRPLYTKRRILVSTCLSLLLLCRTFWLPMKSNWSMESYLALIEHQKALCGQFAGLEVDRVTFWTFICCSERWSTRILLAVFLMWCLLVCVRFTTML